MPQHRYDYPDKNIISALRKQLAHLEDAVRRIQNNYTSTVSVYGPDSLPNEFEPGQIYITNEGYFLFVDSKGQTHTIVTMDTLFGGLYQDPVEISMLPSQIVGTIYYPKLNSNAVGTDEIQDFAVTDRKIADGTIRTAHLVGDGPIEYPPQFEVINFVHNPSFETQIDPWMGVETTGPTVQPFGSGGVTLTQDNSTAVYGSSHMRMNIAGGGSLYKGAGNFIIDQIYPDKYYMLSAFTLADWPTPLPWYFHIEFTDNVGNVTEVFSQLGGTQNSSGSGGFWSKGYFSVHPTHPDTWFANFYIFTTNTTPLLRVDSVSVEMTDYPMLPTDSAYIDGTFQDASWTGTEHVTSTASPGWHHVNTPGESLGYWKDELGYTNLHGVARGGKDESVIFYLGDGYRPARDIFVPVVCNYPSSYAVPYLSILTGGEMRIHGFSPETDTNLSLVYLEGIRFKAV